MKKTVNPGFAVREALFKVAHSSRESRTRCPTRLRGSDGRLGPSHGLLSWYGVRSRAWKVGQSEQSQLAKAVAFFGERRGAQTSSKPSGPESPAAAAATPGISNSMLALATGAAERQRQPPLWVLGSPGSLP